MHVPKMGPPDGGWRTEIPTEQPNRPHLKVCATNVKEHWGGSKRPSKAARWTPFIVGVKTGSDASASGCRQPHDESGCRQPQPHDEEYKRLLKATSPGKDSLDSAYNALGSLLSRQHVEGPSPELEAELDVAWKHLRSLQEDAVEAVYRELEGAVTLSNADLQQLFDEDQDILAKPE